MNGTKTEYLLNGTQILAQKTGSDVMWFFYDSTGTRIGVQQGNVTAYYMYNLQGDVVGLADAATGKIIAKYLYDAWGKCVSVENADGYTIGTANPFRYCGYYYDNETGFYYLQTRYYDPAIARFINADSYLTTDITGFISSNMFAYCENNPVMYGDSDGEAPSLRDYINNFVSKIAPMLMEAMDKAENMVLDAVISAMGLTEARLAVAQTILGENASSSSRADWKLGVAAIAWTIINRVNSTDAFFPDTAYEVVTAPGQYNGYGGGKNMAPNGILIPKEASRQKDWEYINKIAAYVVLKKYDKVPCPDGINENVLGFYGGYTNDYGPMIYGGNLFYYS